MHIGLLYLALSFLFNLSFFLVVEKSLSAHKPSIEEARTQNVPAERDSDDRNVGRCLQISTSNFSSSRDTRSLFANLLPRDCSPFARPITRERATVCAKLPHLGWFKEESRIIVPMGGEISLFQRDFTRVAHRSIFFSHRRAFRVGAARFASSRIPRRRARSCVRGCPPACMNTHVSLIPWTTRYGD